MTLGAIFCGLCGCNTAPACGCRDFTASGSPANTLFVYDPVLLERSMRRWAHGTGKGIPTDAQRQARSEHYEI
jgi:hypothetical protein